MKEQDPIISYLEEEKVLEQVAIDKLVRTHDATGKSLINIIKSQELVDDEGLAKLIAATNHIEFINLSPDMADPIAVQLLSYDIAHQHNLVPVRIEKDCLYVAMSSPLNLSVRDMIATKTGYKVVPMAATPEAIAQVITYNFDVESVTKQDIVQMRLKDKGPTEKSKKTKQQSKVANAPIVRLVDSIITGAIDARASDIHIEPQEPDMKVRYRVDGILIEALEVPSSAQLEVISHIKILAGMDISERRIPQDGHIGVNHHDKDYDLRVSSLPSVSGEKIVIRVLDTTSGLTTLDEIINSKEDYQLLSSLINNPYGMVLLTGPTGSGKTTTLYSMLQELNALEKNIVTVEDPVEYRLNGITQVQVKPEIDMTFASCLRSILRQDPDVVLIGEIRDLETAEIAISASLTGHLVLSTLHTNDAAGAISRLVNLGVSSFQLSSALLGIVAQRLVRSICSKCKESYKPDDEELAELFGNEIPEKRPVLYRGKGCNSCGDTGYRGRQGVYEVLNVVSAVRNMIVEESADDQIKACGMMQGMRTLKMEGIGLVLDGQTTFKELQRVIDMRED
ncbi:MAG TPA: type II/IV secretion system protein [Phycisphaerales bacterium]|nr:type II/IV secretion system protein [Phycisphaerales bacterium]